MSNLDKINSITEDALKELEIAEKNLIRVGEILDDIDNWIQERKKQDEELAKEWELAQHG